VKIDRIRILNLFSYRDTELVLENYNIIVGHNASGKTNLIRLVEFIRYLRAGSGSVYGLSDELYLPSAYRSAPDKSSSLVLHISLSDSEAKALIQVIFRTEIKAIASPEMVKIALAIHWPQTPEARRRPEYVFLRFPNGFSILKLIAGDDVICYTEKEPENLEELQKVITAYPRIDQDAKLVEKYRAAQGIDHNSMLQDSKFLTPFLQGQNIRSFLIVDGKEFSIFSGHLQVTYHDSNIRQFIVEIFEKCNIPLSSGYNVGIWVVLKRFLEDKLVILKDFRLGFDELADLLFRYRTAEGESWKYEQVENNFAELFRGVKFVALERKKTETQQGNPGHVIQISESGKTRELQSSASGYFEALNIFAVLVSADDSILILDEPALNLHPMKIRLLSKILTEMKKQVIINSHSPFFVVPSLFKQGSSVTHVKKDTKGVSRFISKPAPFKLPVKSYVFKPEVFFSACSIFVEGPGDAAALTAISDNLDDIFEHYDILIVDAGGKGNIHNYVDRIKTFELQHLAMVDQDYRKQRLSETADFIVLPGKLEDELAKIGWTGSAKDSIAPDNAYDVVDKAMKSNKARVRLTGIGQVFDAAIKKTGPDPNEVWR
jgi:energy-coupling factor transporter ATP-binding protein EcfA2